MTERTVQDRRLVHVHETLPPAHRRVRRQRVPATSVTVRVDYPESCR